ncbi:MAG: peptidoglycan DD-metalloendopeptidase family protein [Gammaproteobacteria bacterium]|nr:peptidoglycan DD-metalloendopeptidase family protein [Gammaproteobacteria bacterium]NND58650.1 peptidoglycan DD-metalloendopeptidase family protein [Gammaproteobacteria bacterium]
MAAALNCTNWVTAIVCLVLLSACGGGALRWEPRVHIVQAGDTVDAIAFRYRLDSADLAAWNDLDNANIIFAGQRLQLERPADFQPRRARRGRATMPDSGTGTGAGARAGSAQAPVSQPVSQWRWPVTGPVVAQFGDSTSLGRGLDIAGNQGDSVHAAADGRVVYSGSGLLGYGKLIILKHNDTFLSAYGHNSELLVTEGEKVVAGQPIATMGFGPGDKAVLHFEIRQQGKPVDPIAYLPPRDPE